MSTDATEEIAKAKREGMVPGHLVQTSSSSMQIKTELFYEHLLSEHWLVSALYKKNQGQRVIGEPVVSGLVLDDYWLWDPDFATASKYVMSPPIREAGHNKALQAALSSGILQLVGTDHCTFNSTQKAFGSDDFRKIPNGVNGELRLSRPCACP
uniref:Amidohydrolase-related domain-containing protein n=1 Tax=Aegilops tauschii subsp. strangulata TaxID=200361 RepID=A0A453T3K5_AEGTS